MDTLALLAQSADAAAGEPLNRLLWANGHKVAWIIHLLGVFLWLGGLLYLTRVLGAHMKEVGKPGFEHVHAAMTRMEKRLHHFAVTPGLVLALIGGVWSLAAYNMAKLKMGWFHLKLTIAVFFIILQVVTILRVYKLERNPPTMRSPIFAIIHGLSGLLLVGVLVLIMFQPF